MLLDTHMVLWLMRGDSRAEHLVPILDDDASTFTISAVSLTEIAIKHSLRRLPETVRAVRAAAREFRFLELAFDGNHAESLEALEPHHRDPFDRMLIAQALSEDYVIATTDRQFAQYEGLRIHGVA